MNGYTVVKINSFEQASEYAKYNSWCITQQEKHFRSYTENDKQFYFLLKEEFEHTCRKKKSGCPLDKYGLSMISILVDINGKPTVVTTRWNHTHQGKNNPNLITKKQIEDITGLNFDDTFKPKYNIKEKLNEITARIKNGKKTEGLSLKKIKNNIQIIGFNKLFNIIDKDNNILFKEWYSNIIHYDNGLYQVVRTDNLYNIIDINEKPLFKNWYQYIFPLNNGLYRVRRTDGLYNIIDKDNNYLFKEWYKFIYPIDNGLYEVQRTDDLFNVIDINENPKYKTWYW